MTEILDLDNDQPIRELQVKLAMSRQQEIPPGDPDFERLYRRRNDAESINRHLDDTLWLRRAHSIGHLRQTLNLLTYALGINALALHLHRQRHAPPHAA